MAGILITTATLIFAAPARAQEVTPTPSVPASPSPVPPTTPAPAAALDSTTARLILLLGAAALVLLYIYLFAWRQSWARIADKTLATTGRLPALAPVQSQAAMTAMGGPAGPGGAPTMTLQGPPLIPTGTPAGPYTVVDSTGQPVTTVKWATDSGNVTCNPPTGPSTEVTATQPGAFKLSATVGPDTAQISVVAVTPDAQAQPAGQVPLVAAGYAAITIAILAVTLAGTLTAIGVLPGAALATLLGTVVSYFFVQRAAGSAEREGRPPRA